MWDKTVIMSYLAHVVYVGQDGYYVLSYTCSVCGTRRLLCLILHMVIMYKMYYASPIVFNTF